MRRHPLSYIVDAIDELFSEAESSEASHLMLDAMYPRISAVLSTPAGDKRFKQIVGAYMDRNNEKLHTSGPVYMIPFGDVDKAQFFTLFKIEPKEIQDLVIKITEKINNKSDFKLLRNNPIFWVFYLCIRYYTLKKDEKGLNTALVIYALSVYPSVYHVFFPHQPNEAVMQYTMDHLSEKYLMKQAGHVFGGLFLSIKHSYAFLNPYLKDASDAEIIRFIQRIRNDQKSMIKNICDQYMQNHRKGLRVKLTKDSYDEVQIDIDAENNSTIVEIVANNVVNQIITNGLDMKRVSQCYKIANIGLSDCRYYLSKVISVNYTNDIKAFIHAILFLFLYIDHKTKEDINSSYFLVWSSELFRKTNSNDDNIRIIKQTLDKWGEETGVHEKFKREASRVSYKRAIFWYFILSIQYYNK